MTTFYDRAGIRITERRLTVGSRSYPVEHLRNFRMARGQGDRITRHAVYLATLALLVVAVTGPFVPVPMSMIIAAVFVAPPAVIAAVRARLIRPTYLLWADYQGRTVQLHETRNETEFGKISRALVRASTYGRHGVTVPADLRAVLVVPGRTLGLPGEPGR